MEVTSMGGAKYFLTFKDDFSRKVFVYFLKKKSEVITCFVKFKALVENETGRKIRCVRSDNGTEYCNRDLNAVLIKHGIRHQTTVPYTPQQNGTSERLNRIILEKAKCMLFNSGLSKIYWAEAVSTAVYLINISPTKRNNTQTPHELWSGKKPDVSHLRIFGCKAMVYVSKEKRQKWDPRSEEMNFVGYCEDTKGYRLINPRNLHLVKSRDVKFIENVSHSSNVQNHPVTAVPDDSFINSTVESHSDTIEPVVLLDLDSHCSDFQSLNECDSENCSEQYLDGEDDDQESRNTQQVMDTANLNPSEVRRSERVPKPRNMTDYVVYTSMTNEVCDPETVADALNRIDSEQWKKAMQEEYDALILNNTWTLIDLPSNRRSINCKWVFKTKLDSGGNIQRYKARLVIKGCAQKKGVDYQETFSPVVRYSSIRYLLAIAAQYDLDIEQMDAVTAFLQGDLSEEIYMVQPEYFSKGPQVCKLNKAIYGLKQASREWNKKLDKVLIAIGLRRSKVDPCIYFNVEKGKLFFIAIYVDDFLIVSNDGPLKQKVKTELKAKFTMKDLGEAKCCVGLTINRNREKGEIYIDQERYSKEILARFNMSECKPVLTPSDPNQKLTKNEKSNDMSNIPYQEAVGSLLYLVQGTRPDLAYAVNNVSRYSNNFDQSHWTAVKRIFRYLRGTVNVKLKYSKNSNCELIGYSDADWAGDQDGRRSCTGYVFVLQGGAISWSSRLQQTVALSTTEAEYMALSAATQEAEWLRQLQIDIFSEKLHKSVLMFCDNRSALNLATTDAYHPRTKHIDVRHHFVRQKLVEDHIVLKPIDTENMVADVLTKALTKVKHDSCIEKFGLCLVK